MRSSTSSYSKRNALEARILAEFLPTASCPYRKSNRVFPNTCAKQTLDVLSQRSPASKSRPFRAGQLSSLQLIQSDGKIADAFAGGMIDRVGDRRRYADDANLAHLGEDGFVTFVGFTCQ